MSIVVTTKEENDEKSYKGEELVDNKYNSLGLPICRLCGKAQVDIKHHITEIHKISVDDYAERYKGAPLNPIEGVSTKGSILSYQEREKKEFSVKETFGFWWKEKDGKKIDRTIEGYKTPGPLTPEIDSDYVFNPEYTTFALLGLYLRDRVLTYGNTGTGKTSLWQQIAARLNMNFVRISFDSGIVRDSLIGQWIVKDKEMFFSYGILPLGMLLPGTIICLDEWDTISDECCFVLQRPLESLGQLLIMENGEEIITLHKDNIFVATANTFGMGDESGLYSQGTRIQNYSQINRFSLTIEMEYLPPEQEKKILLNKFGPSATRIKGEMRRIDENEADVMVMIVNKVRQAYMRSEIASPLSTRDLINWSEKYLMLGGNVEKAAKYCFINRMPREDREVVLQIIRRTFE